MIDYDYCEQMAMAEAMPIIAKLASRKERGVIDGEGDNR